MRILLAVMLLLSIGCGSYPVKGKSRILTTKDNAKVSIEKFSPANPDVTKLPVVIVHGLGANRNYFKFNDRKSLTARLTAAGYEVYLCDLRGRESAGRMKYFGKGSYTYTLDEYARYDLDTILTSVTAEAGTNRVNYIGHSTGGLVAYMRIGSFAEERIANLVTISAPGLFTPVERNLAFAVRMQGGLKVLPVLPLGNLAHVAGALRLPPLPPALGNILYHKPNLNKGDENRLLKYVANNISKGELRQFANAVLQGEIKSYDGRVNYTSALSNVRVPILLIGGRRDNLIPPAIIREVYERVGSTDKSMRIVSRQSGARADYGHTDIVIGKYADIDVHDPLIEWLDQRNRE